MFSQAVFMRKQVDKMVRTRYKAFLSEEEISAVVKGEDLFFDADEIMERLEVYAEARNEQGCGDPSCEDCSEPEELQSRTLEEIIKEAVAEALESKFPSVVKAAPEKKITPSRRKLPKKVEEEKE